MKRIGLIVLGLTILLPARAGLPPPSRNGVLRTGASLTELLDPGLPDSLHAKCLRELHGIRLFSSFCGEFLEQLQRKMNLMVVETDIQIQAERLDSGPQSREPRLLLLLELNTAAMQAEGRLRLLRGDDPGRGVRERLEETLPDAKKVRDIFEAYARLKTDGRS